MRRAMLIAADVFRHATLTLPRIACRYATLCRFAAMLMLYDLPRACCCRYVLPRADMPDDIYASLPR